MSGLADQSDLMGAVNQMMRRALSELDDLRAASARTADEVTKLREDVRQALVRIEREAWGHADSFSPNDLGDELRQKLTKAFGDAPPHAAPEAPPASLEAAREEWERLAEVHWAVEKLVTAKVLWDHRAFLFRRRRWMPTVPVEVWRSTERLSEIYTALPPLREALVADRVRAASYLHTELEAEIERRTVSLEQMCAAARDALEEVERSAGLTGAAWSHPGWSHAAPAGEIQRVLRLGELEARLPESAAIASIPALVEFPFHSGLAVASDVEHRRAAIDLARSLIFRLLAAVPAGDVRFVFFDPVSLGQSVAEFRHLAEFDPRLVDVKTWTSERDVESRLDELSDHLEVVISNYLRGQFDSIDDYNRQAGEVAEPYCVLVVFDYPEGFSGRSARQLLSLIENGPRCGLHTILLYDPGREAPDGVPVERLVHSMQRIELNRGRLTLAEPIGPVDLDFTPDVAPPISFSPDGQPSTVFAQMLLNIGMGARSTQSGPVTLERLMSVANKLINSGRSQQIARLEPGSPDIDPSDPSTWWTGISTMGAFAPIGRAGAQDLAALYFSSTDIAGGAILVGVPRSGKSTALHAAILSLSLFYSPDELELYLIDSKHGVEFKVYDTLPHARLVSINSEREFSVSVLRSLDGEIARRADLMKRHTAGKANITEYRQATGERLARMVLFMDEFHEVFEEDDALGQEAFRAFSNIVRQGPFAGVHVVVASQTLSSMPAMDRGTLSLLPMRVAFMCNESDADLVMGDMNREVKALSQQGEGIFNPARGDPSHNKPFRGLYVAPDERDRLLRDLVVKASTLDFERRPRVFDGDTLAERPAERPSGPTTRPVFALGEPLTLEPWAGVVLRRARAANLLLLGTGDDDSANPDTSLEGATDSCLAEAATQGLDVQVVDFLGDHDTRLDALGLMALCQALGASYRRGSALAEVVAEAAGKVRARQIAGDYSGDGRMLILNGLHRALGLVPEDPYAEPNDSGELGIAGPLATILREGPDVGYHTVVVLDGLARFDMRLGREMLKEFEWRLAASGLGVHDIAAITESYTEGEIRHNQLLLVDRDKARSRRIRAYPRHTASSVQTILVPAEREAL